MNSAVKAPTVAELLSLDQVICDACDACGWTEGGTDFAVGSVCAKCAGKGVVPSSAVVLPPPERIGEALPPGITLTPAAPGEAIQGDGTGTALPPL